MTEVRTVLAPNPSLYTGPGTNTYILSDSAVAVVIDPGPVIPSHLDAVVAALGDDEAAAIVVTHTHPDHAPAANPLGKRLGVPVLGFGPGPDFTPDRRLGDGDRFEHGELSLVAVHTPGHAADHLCYLVGDLLFTGDHIMGGSTVVIEDAAAYMDSLQRVADLRPRHLYPGHGPELPDAEAAVTNYIEHRKARERQIVDAVAGGATSVDDLVAVVYGDIDPGLHGAAEYQVRTQLKKLAAEGRVSWRPGNSGLADLILPSGE